MADRNQVGTAAATTVKALRRKIATLSKNKADALAELKAERAQVMQNVKERPSGISPQVMARISASESGVQQLSKAVDQAVDKAMRENLATVVKVRNDYDERIQALTGELLLAKEVAEAVAYDEQKAVFLEAPFSKVKTPYETGCKRTRLHDFLKRDNMPSALNLQLIWLIKEALYSTGYGESAVGVTTHTDPSFDEKLPEKLVQAVMEVVVESLAIPLLEGREERTVWLEMADQIQGLKGSFADTSFLYLNRLQGCIDFLFDLYKEPEAAQLTHLWELDESAIFNDPRISLEVRVHYYLASVKLQRPAANVNAGRLSELSDTLKGAYRESEGSLLMGESGISALLEQLLAVRRASIVREEGSSVVSQLFQGGLKQVKQLAGVHLDGNLGVVLAAFKSETEIPVPASRSACSM